MNARDAPLAAFLAVSGCNGRRQNAPAFYRPDAGVLTLDPALGAFARPANIALSRGSGWLLLLRPGLEHHFVSDAFESASQPLRRALRIAAVEVISADFAILAAIPQNMPGDDENPMGYGDGGLLHSASSRDAVKQRRQVTVFLVRHYPGILHQHAAQIAIAFPGTAGMTFAGALSFPSSRFSSSSSSFSSQRK